MLWFAGGSIIRSMLLHQPEGDRPNSGIFKSVNTEPTPLFPGGAVAEFRSKSDRLYTIETYYSNGGNRRTFLELPEYHGLVDTLTRLYLDIYPNRDRKISIDRMKQTLNHPRTILKLIRYEDDPVGFGVFPKLLIYGEPVVYSSRAFKRRHESQGMGTLILREAVEEHRRESQKAHRSLRWVAFMTQNPYSELTAEKLATVEENFPFGSRYSESSEAKWYLLGVHHQVHMSSLGIDTVTGVSRGELREIGMNERGRPDRKHVRAWEIYQEMVSAPPAGLGMNREAGDVVYVLLRLKKSDPSGLEAPVIPPAA